MCKKITILLVAAVLLTGISSLSWGSYILQYQGNITSSIGDGTLVATASWDWESGTSNYSNLEWSVYQENGTGEWKYEYTFTVPAKAISHSIIEVSQNFPGFQYTATGTDPSTGSQNLIIDPDAPKWYESTGSSGSNPGMPDVDLEPGGEGDLYGIKWDAPDIANYDPLVFSIIILTDREPMWGDFYAKDGQDGATKVYAYNSGFGQDTTAPVADGNARTIDGLAWVLVPDTEVTVPEPTTLLLLGLGLIILGGCVRRRKS